jgi:hypothetical protein
MTSGLRLGAALLLAVVAASAAAACGSTTSHSSAGSQGPNPGDSGPDSTTPQDGASDSGPLLGGGDGSSPADGALLAITPADDVVDVTVGQPAAPVQYSTTAGGQPVTVSWSIDRGEIGAIGVGTGVFTPTGTVGGTASITATWAGQSVSTTITVHLHMVQNGAAGAADAGGDDAEAGNGAGGNGGVGGEGPGGPVSPTTQQVLMGSPMADTTLGFLYPYTQTVWPRGILPPLLQWTAGTHDFDGVFIHISEAAFDYQGFFANTATPFIHHPVDPAAWQAMAYSNAGEDVTVTLVFSQGGTAWGPIVETWKVASGTLKGTVYYNSYGTNLAHNLCCTVGGASFGGATLAVKGGSTSPVLIAGNDSECRVCHSVSANGAQLITQQQDNSVTSAYALTNNDTETVMSPADSRFAWGGLYPDGTFIFSNSAAQQGASTLPSTLYAIPAGTAITPSGLPSGLQAGCPVFSPDGNHVAFNYFGGPAGDQKTLVTMGFAQPTNTFSALTTLYTPSVGRAVWPSFLPTSNAVAFEHELTPNAAYGETRNGVQAELWWVDLATQTPTRLDQANGLNYLPVGANNHATDWLLNYEPTVNPVVSGGYAWMVFTSRRMYGNVATIDPTWSDPRNYDLTVTPTTKKLWVAAIDLNAAPGTDPSHPAFYLPGQELLAGNSRGYWVVDPCHVGGTGCLTGDECCGGYCEAASDGGGLECTSQMPTCSQEFEKCTTSADCCGAGQGIQCINMLCSQAAPQ